MTSDPDRLTILEMEFALVSARLSAIDGQLALIREELRQGLSGVTVGLIEHMDERFAEVATKDDVAALDAKLDTIIGRLP